MKNLIFLLSGLFFTLSVVSQNKEFKTYANGLIYSERTMSKLTQVVDSLNLKFKTCNFDRVFYSKAQAIGHLVKLNTGDINSAQRDLEQDISFEDFLMKYPNSEVEKNILIVKSKYKSYDDKETVRIEHFNLKSDYGFYIKSEDLSLFERDFKNKWLFEYSEESEYSKERIDAFFFPENFRSIELPKQYSLMIGYSDCLIDTTTTKLKDDLEEGRVELPENWKKMSKKKKSELLDEMRSKRVVGFCSMDMGPRKHAVNIALLSAETYNWEVFLKSHLDIMNDRFDRMSDGSYAWEGRNTYIKELEELNINVIDLIAGISFRIENPAANHYYGSIGRVGRALSETKNREEVEDTILAVITNDELDNYNRLIFYFLFKNYNYYLEDESLQSVNNEKLANAAKSLPPFFSKPLSGK